MKKNILLSFVFMFLALNGYSKTKEHLVYIKPESSHCNVYFEEDKWISEEKITIRNSADRKIMFEFEGIFKTDYKNKFIAETYKLKSYADKNRKNRFFEIGENEKKEFIIYFFGKNTGKNQKTNRLPSENMMISECGNKITLLESDYKIISRKENRLELELENRQIIFMLQELSTPLIEFELDGKRKMAGGIPIYSSSVPLFCDYMFILGKDGKTMLWCGNILILDEI